MTPQRENEAFHVEDLPQCILVEASEDTLLETIHEFVELVEDWEVGVHGFVDNGVHQTRCARSRELGSLPQNLDCRIDGMSVTSVNGDEIIPSEKAREVDCLYVVRVFGVLDKNDGTHDEDDEALILIELDARLRVETVLNCEGMELEHVAEQRDLR